MPAGMQRVISCSRVSLVKALRSLRDLRGIVSSI